MKLQPISYMLFAVALAWPLPAEENWSPVNTQAADQNPPSPEQSLRMLRVPEGFRLTLAAAEPDVRQPIAIAFDDRGRLWVAESYSYDGSDFTEEPRDRVLIFEDEDGDGVLEKRTVFQDGLNRLTGLALGFGGVWITAPPHLSWIPDRNGDDRPDGPPVVHLSGWTLRAEHNSVNGLTWGPDGWLYGRHGIKQPSRVGRPETADKDRVSLSCCIWRYHPTRHEFEVVCDGTVNPWGLDFDESGLAFFSSSVVDHLWHLAPGGHFQRRKNQDAHPNPHVYELMDPACDHLHWDDRDTQRSEGLSRGNDAFGGGHAHCDAMIYLGDRWPEEYRGSVFLSNIHGRRINRDSFRVSPDGRRMAVHETDFLVSQDPWFRSVSMQYGPDGDVYLTDWSDLGECHDRDGVHRSSGRIYKVSWGDPRRVPVNLGELSNEELVRLQRHPNEWYVRHARRRLQERAAHGEPMEVIRQQLLRDYQEHRNPRHRLRAMWALNATGGASPEWLTDQFRQDDESLRAWAVRLLSEQPEIQTDQIEALANLAQQETSWLVRMELASAAAKIPVADRGRMVWNLARRSSSGEANLERMIWYALEPVVAADVPESLRLVDTKLPSRLRGFVGRRAADELASNPRVRDPFFQTLQRAESTDVLADLLTGANKSLVRHRPSVEIGDWSPFLAGLTRHADPGVQRAAITTAMILGDDPLVDSLAGLLHQNSVDEGIRREILQRMIDRRPTMMGPHLCRLIREQELVSSALATAGAVDDPELTRLLIAIYGQLTREQQVLAINALIARAGSARQLLQAMEGGAIPTRDLASQQAVQIAAFKDPEVAQLLSRVWGAITTTSANRKKQIRDLKYALRPDFLAEANFPRGRQLFQEKCSVCHRLFGEGKQIAPDLTGSQRKNLDYVLLNVVDPNATVPADYRMSIVVTTDGRVITGCILESDSGALTIQTATEQVHLRSDDVDEIKTLPTSLMPEDLFNGMHINDIRNLIAYLMSDG